MQFDGQITNIKMYQFALAADDIWGLFHNKIVLYGTERDNSTAKQAGSAYYMIDANIYTPEEPLINALSCRIIQLLSAIDRKFFDKIWPPRKAKKNGTEKATTDGDAGNSAD